MISTAQWLLFAFGAFGIFSALLLSLKGKRAEALGFVTAALVSVLVAAVNPESISELSTSTDGVAMKRTVSPEYLQGSLEFAIGPSNISPQDASAITQEAKTVAPDERTDVDLLVLASDAFNSGDYDSQMKFAEAGLALPSSDVRVKASLLHQLAIAFEMKDNLTKAVTTYDKAISADPSFSWAYNGRGVALTKLRKYEDAVHSFDKAIETASETDVKSTAMEFKNRGIALDYLGRFDEAIASYDEAIRRDPSFASAHFHKAITLRENGQYENALEAFGEAIKQNPRDAEAYKLRGDIYEIMGKTAEAAADYDRANRIKSSLN